VTALNMDETTKPKRSPRQLPARVQMTSSAPGNQESTLPRLKVCIASMAPFIGGAEVAAERLALGLKEEGHEVFTLLGKKGAVKDRMEKVGLRCIYSPMFFTDKWHYPRYWLARRRLRQILVAEQPDIVHSNDLPTHQIVSDAARGLGTPRICHHRFPFPSAAIDWLNKFGSERHLFISRAIRNEMCAESERLRAAPQALVYDGLPIPQLPDVTHRLHARQTLGLPANQVVAIIAGQVVEIKGVADLIEGWALLDPKIRASALLVVVGDDLARRGAYRRQVQQLADRLGVAARFVGFQKDVSEWLRAADIAVVPSHVEPLGLAAMEAMSFALPVIGSRVGGIPEMVVHEVTGLLVEAKNPPQLCQAVSRLVSDAALRQRLGKEGRARCEELFSLRTHTRAVLAEYYQILGSCGAKHRS
jgi:glycosyltransferase involved in cell wall biosynthesis